MQMPNELIMQFAKELTIEYIRLHPDLMDHDIEKSDQMMEDVSNITNRFYDKLSHLL